jgi:hypothetical protein
MPLPSSRPAGAMTRSSPLMSGTAAERLFLGDHDPEGSAGDIERVRGLVQDSNTTPGSTSTTRRGSAWTCRLRPAIRTSRSLR